MADGGKESKVEKVLRVVSLFGKGASAWCGRTCLPENKRDAMTYKFKSEKRECKAVREGKNCYREQECRNGLSFERTGGRDDGSGFGKKEQRPAPSKNAVKSKRKVPELFRMSDL